MSQARPLLIAYTLKRNPDLDANYRVTYSNPTFFNQPELKYEYFYSNRPDIVKAYAKYSDKVERITLEAPEKPSEPPKEETKAIPQVEAEDSSQDDSDQSDSIPEDYADLPWPQLRALASKHTDEKQFNKEKALEILAEAKGA